MELVHEREGLLGEIYLDLHPRQALAFMRSSLCPHPALPVSSATSQKPFGVDSCCREQFGAVMHAVGAGSE